ncbi:hypothetical protein HY571_03015 [Candidatus Micrarchaeota archaeon]|nr:hypothetical protein [Candidatus Micrarchaeota archaeon]
MSQLINIADDLYSELTKLKKAKGASYTEVIREGMFSNKQKTGSWNQMFEHVAKLEKKFKGPKEYIDIDKIVYGVSREGD